MVDYIQRQLPILLVFAGYPKTTWCQPMHQRPALCSVAAAPVEEPWYAKVGVRGLTTHMNIHCLVFWHTFISCPSYPFAGS